MTRAGRVLAAARSGPLGVRSFQLLTVGQLTSTIGDYVYAVALPWLVLSAHGGTILLGTVLACYGVPRTVLIPVGGMLADRIGPLKIMLAADTVRCLLVVLLGVVAARHVTALAVLGPIAAFLGAGEGVFMPSSMAIMPSLLVPDQLQAGNGLNSAALEVGSLVGPALGGVLVAAAGSAVGFAIDAASFAVSAGTLALMQRLPRARPTRPAEAAAPATPAEPAAGAAAPAEAAAAPPTDRDSAAILRPDEQPTVWSLLLHARVLQALLLVTVVANLTAGGTFEVALPDLAHVRYGATGYGALLACLGAGAMAGTLASTLARSLRRPAVVACSAFLVLALAVAMVPFVRLAGAAAMMFLLGAGMGFGNVIMITLTQQWAPPALLGRVMSLVMLGSLGSFPVSVAVAGAVVHRLGPVPFFPVCGAVLALAIVLALASGEVRSLGARKDREAGEPAAELG